MQSLRFQLIEDTCTESVKTAWFIRPQLMCMTYYSFASYHVNIDHHDTPHVTLRTRPSFRFSVQHGNGPGDEATWSKCHSFKVNCGSDAKISVSFLTIVSDK